MLQTQFAENIKTHISYSITLLESHAVYEIMWKNMLQPDRPYDMRFACRVTKFTDTHTHTHTVCNIYYFATATMVTRTLNVTFISKLPVFFKVRSC